MAPVQESGKPRLVNLPSDKSKSFTEGVESLMKNSSNDKAGGGSKIDDLPVAVPDSSNLRITEVGRVDIIPHVCENQVGLAEAAVHLTEKAHLIQISSQGKPSSGKQIF